MKALLFLVLFWANWGTVDAQNRSWVFFTAKSAPECAQSNSRGCLLAPLDDHAMSAVELAGGNIRSVSRWLNAVSVEAAPEVLERLATLETVVSVSPVQALSTKKNVEDGFYKVTQRQQAPMQTMLADSTYGIALEQTRFHKIDMVHETGLFGDGVKVGVIDGGFDMKHPAFAHLLESGRLIGERDFVDGGNDTKVNVRLSNYHSHGTSTAGMIAGRIDGKFFGVAPGVALAVARTEDDTQEAVVEEDHWVEAIEWLQTLGIQVVSSSLGYTTFTTNPQNSHSYDDLDGRTTVISRAAVMAASVFNMVVVTSAGNEGDKSWRYVTAPADADSILAVGSVNAAGVRALSSSVGPTADGRIKPDVSARGACVSSPVSSPADTLSTCLNGTSFAAPIVAGIVALAVQARPGMESHWYLQKVKQASSQAMSPDNLLGYGIVDAYQLIQSLNLGTALETETAAPPDRFLLTSNYPNPFNPATTLTYKADRGWMLESVRVVDVTGRVVVEWIPSRPSSSGSWNWDGATAAGLQAASGVYIALFRFSNGTEHTVKPHAMSLIK